MRDRVITESHFNYANKFVKILGFNGLIDWTKQIPYANLKTSQDEICQSINKTLDIFKALFPQDSFNLRKIHYKFENIDQVLGFFKKVMSWLSIPYEMVRLRGAFYLRLTQQKTSLYNEYISRMEQIREMPQKFTPPTPTLTYTPTHIKVPDQQMNSSIMFSNNLVLPSGNIVQDANLNNIDIPNPNTSNPFVLEKSHKFSKVLQTYPKTNISKTVLVKSDILLSAFKDINYIESIEILGVKGGLSCPLYTNTYISAYVSEKTLVHEQIIQESDQTNPYIFHLDFPNSFFYEYHSLELKISNSGFELFRIKINGYKFSKKITNLSGLFTDHDPKYYDEETGYQWNILNGMIGCSIIGKKMTGFDHENLLQKYEKQGLLTVMSQTYLLPEPITWTGLSVDNDDNLNNISYGLVLLESAKLKNYNFVMSNVILNIKFRFIEPSENSCSIYYVIPRSSDAIGKIKLTNDTINKITQHTSIKASICNDLETIPIGSLDNSNTYILLDNFYYLVNKQHITNYLVLEVSSVNIHKWMQIDLIFGILFFNRAERRQIALNPYTDLKNT